VQLDWGHGEQGQVRMYVHCTKDHDIVFQTIRIIPTSTNEYQRRKMGSSSWEQKLLGGITHDTLQVRIESEDSSFVVVAYTVTKCIVCFPWLLLLSLDDGACSQWLYRTLRPVAVWLPPVFIPSGCLSDDGANVSLCPVVV